MYKSKIVKVWQSGYEQEEGEDSQQQVYLPRAAAFLSCLRGLTCVGQPFPTYRTCVQSFVFLIHNIYKRASQPLRSFVSYRHSI